MGSDIAGSKCKRVRLSLFHSPSVTGRRRADAAPRVCFNQEQYCREPPLPLPTPVLTPTQPSLFFVPQNKQLVPLCQEDEVHTHRSKQRGLLAQDFPFLLGDKVTGALCKKSPDAPGTPGPCSAGTVTPGLHFHCHPHATQPAGRGARCLPLCDYLTRASSRM